MGSLLLPAHRGGHPVAVDRDRLDGREGRQAGATAAGFGDLVATHQAAAGRGQHHGYAVPAAVPSIPRLSSDRSAALAGGVALLLVQLVLVQRVAAVHRVLQRLHVVVQVSRVGLRRLWFTLGGHGLTVRQSGGVRGTSRQSVLHPAYPGTVTEFAYSDLLPLGPDETEYRLVTDQGVETFEAGGQRFLRVDPLALTRLTDEAMHDIAHYLRPAHLAQLRRIVDDPESSGNDRFVALDLLKNANIAAAGVLPMCQDTGTAIVMGKKGERVVTGGDDAAAISRGVYDAYTRLNLRYSQLAP